MSSLKTCILCAGLACVSAPSLAGQQQPIQIFGEARGGAVVPTFDIADVATTGPSFGLTLGFHLEPRWVIMAEFDYGFHEDDPSGLLDINTIHYMAKVGYSFNGPRNEGWEWVGNLGIGGVTFDVEDAPNTFTYFAISAGGKVIYHIGPRFGVVLSPQGHIAFSDSDEVGTSDSWVWPFTAGLRVKF